MRAHIKSIRTQPALNGNPDRGVSKLTGFVIVSIRVDCAIHHREQLTHLGIGKPSREPFDEILLLDHGDKVSLQEPRFSKAGFAGLRALGGRARGTVTPEWDSEERTYTLASITLIQRDDYKCMFFCRRYLRSRSLPVSGQGARTNPLSFPELREQSDSGRRIQTANPSSIRSELNL